MKSQLKIISFEEIYAKTFYQLNIEWLEAFFFVEDFDREVLSNPKKYIIEKGGYIFFLLENTEIIGTIALMKKKEMIYVSYLVLIQVSKLLLNNILILGFPTLEQYLETVNVCNIIKFLYV